MAVDQRDEAKDVNRRELSYTWNLRFRIIARGRFPFPEESVPCSKCMQRKLRKWQPLGPDKRIAVNWQATYANAEPAPRIVGSAL